MITIIAFCKSIYVVNMINMLTYSSLQIICNTYIQNSFVLICQYVDGICFHFFFKLCFLYLRSFVPQDDNTIRNDVHPTCHPERSEGSAPLRLRSLDKLGMTANPIALILFLPLILNARKELLAKHHPYTNNSSQKSPDRQNQGAFGL